MLRKVCGCGIIFNSEGELLVGKKIKYDAWEFPGGKMNGNERVITTAAREVQEETGLLIPNLMYIGYYDWHPKYLVHMFTAIEDGEPKLTEPDKHYEWMFMPEETLVVLPLTKPCEDVIKLGFVEAARKTAFNPVAYEGLITR